MDNGTKIEMVVPVRLENIRSLSENTNHEIPIHAVMSKNDHSSRERIDAKKRDSRFRANWAERTAKTMITKASTCRATSRQEKGDFRNFPESLQCLRRNAGNPQNAKTLK